MQRIPGDSHAHKPQGGNYHVCFTNRYRSFRISSAILPPYKDSYEIRHTKDYRGKQLNIHRPISDYISLPERAKIYDHTIICF